MVQRLSLILCCLLLSSCTACGGASWVSPIYISKDDRLTEGTSKQILTLNRSLEKQDKK